MSWIDDELSLPGQVDRGNTIVNGKILPVYLYYSQYFLPSDISYVHLSFASACDILKFLSHIYIIKY